LVAVFRYICYMLRKFILLILVFITFYSFSQVDSTYVDDNYLEDQLYIGLTYNVLNNKPTGFNQNGLSGGLSFGFIKDLPINEKRNKAIGIGLGYSYNAYIQNLKITDTGSSTVFEIIEAQNFNSNRLSTHAVEVPIELRWRTSTPSDYSFWRIYTGIKLGYLFASNARFSDTSGTIILKGIDKLNTFQYGLTLSAGYGTLNLNLYYGLNTFFENAQVNNEPIDLKQLNIGLIFYIM
jgi:hypothetical protein